MGPPTLAVAAALWTAEFSRGKEVAAASGTLKAERRVVGVLRRKKAEENSLTAVLEDIFQWWEVGGLRWSPLWETPPGEVRSHEKCGFESLNANVVITRVGSLEENVPGRQRYHCLKFVTIDNLNYDPGPKGRNAPGSKVVLCRSG